MELDVNAEDREPLFDKECYAADKKRYTPHDGVPERSAKAYHDEDNANPGSHAQSSLVRFGEEEVNQGAEYPDNNYNGS